MTSATVDHAGGWWDGGVEDRDGRGDLRGRRPLLLPVDASSDLNAVLEQVWRWNHPEKPEPFRSIDMLGGRAVFCGGHFIVYALPPEVDFMRQFVWPDHEKMAATAREAWGSLPRPSHIESEDADDADGSEEEERWITEMAEFKEWGWASSRLLDRSEAAQQAIKDWAPLRAAVGPGVSPALALAAVTPRCVQKVLVLPDAELSAKASQSLRTWSGGVALERQQKTIRLRDIKGIRVPGDDPPSEAEAAGAAEPAWEEIVFDRQLEPPVPFVPVNLLGVEVPGGAGEAAPVATLAWTTSGLYGFQGFFYRRMLHGEALLRACTPEGIRHLAEVALGVRPRTEDDRTLSASEVLMREGAHWSVGSPDPVDQPMWVDGKAKGYPVRTVASVCREVLHLRSPLAAGLSPGDVVVPLRGEHAAAARRVSLEPPDFEGKPVTDVLAADAAEAGECLVLRCGDPEFLLRQIADTRRHLIVRGLGSEADPVIPHHLVRETKIFWPGARERARLLAATRKLEADAWELRDDKSWLASAIDSLREQVLELGHRADNFDDLEPVSPFAYRRDVEEIRGSLRAIEEALRDQTGVLWDPPPPPQPPLTLGFQARRARVDPGPDPEKHRYERADLILRHHAFLGLALLEAADPAAVPPLLAREWSGADAFHGSMGHWKQVSIRCIKAFKDHRLLHRLPDHLRPLAERYASQSTKAAAEAADSIMGLRNDHAHRLASGGRRDGNWIGYLDAEMAKLEAAFGAGAAATPVLVEGRRNGRTSVTLSLRHLVGDNEFVEATDLPVDAAAAATAIDGEVHALTGSGWSLLPLDPWIVHRPGQPGDNATVWLFDGWKKGLPLYQSPLRPGKLVAPDLAERLREIRRGPDPFEA